MRPDWPNQTNSQLTHQHPHLLQPTQRPMSHQNQHQVTLHQSQQHAHQSRSYENNSVQPSDINSHQNQVRPILQPNNMAMNAYPVSAVSQQQVQQNRVHQLYRNMPHQQPPPQQPQTAPQQHQTSVRPQGAGQFASLYQMHQQQRHQQHQTQVQSYPTSNQPQAPLVFNSLHQTQHQTIATTTTTVTTTNITMSTAQSCANQVLGSSAILLQHPVQAASLCVAQPFNNQVQPVEGMSTFYAGY
jgi:hypothetical protein